MQIKRIAECFKGNILQYFRPSLSYHLALRHLSCLFLSDHLRYITKSPSDAMQQLETSSVLSTCKLSHHFVPQDFDGHMAQPGFSIADLLQISPRHRKEGILKKLFQEYHQSGRQFVSRFGSKLFSADNTSRRRQCFVR